MAHIAFNASFQMERIISVVEHGFVVVGFQKNSVTLTEMFNHMLTRTSDIRQNTDVNGITGHPETAGICCIVEFGKRKNGQSANLDGNMRIKRFPVGRIKLKPAVI